MAYSGPPLSQKPGAVAPGQSRAARVNTTTATQTENKRAAAKETNNTVIPPSKKPVPVTTVTSKTSAKIVASTANAAAKGTPAKK